MHTFCFFYDAVMVVYGSCPACINIGCVWFMSPRVLTLTIPWTVLFFLGEVGFIMSSLKYSRPLVYAHTTKKSNRKERNTNNNVMYTPVHIMLEK